MENLACFSGTEISYEDMESKKLDNYTYRILQEETYHKRPCWVIELVPTPGYAPRSNYSKSISWIDKERFITLKSILYNRQGRRIKRITNSKIEKISGIWTMKQMLVNNLETKRLTVFRLDDRFLTRRTLTDPVFREQHLNRYRTTLQ